MAYNTSLPVVSFNSPLASGLVAQTFFVADRACRVVSIVFRHATAAGAAANLQVFKDGTMTSPGSGTALLTNNTNAGFDLNGSINSMQTGVLSATPANLVLASGDALSVAFTGTLGSSAGVTVSVILAPI